MCLCVCEFLSVCPSLLPLSVCVCVCVSFCLSLPPPSLCVCVSFCLSVCLSLLPLCVCVCVFVNCVSLCPLLHAETHLRAAAGGWLSDMGKYCASLECHQPHLQSSSHSKCVLCVCVCVRSCACKYVCVCVWIYAQAAVLDEVCCVCV